MAEIGFVYTGDVIEKCDACQCGELECGDLVKLTLDGTDPLWPEYLRGTIYFIEPTTTGRVYKIKVEQDDLNGGSIPQACNVEVTCYSQLQILIDELTTGLTHEGLPSPMVANIAALVNTINTDGALNCTLTTLP